MATNTEKNIAKLKAQGVPSSMISNYGNKLDDKETSAILSKYNNQKATQVAQTNEKYKNIPDALKNDPAFSSLSNDQKDIVAYNYQVQQQNNAQKIQALNQALEQATLQADPYWKQIIRIAQTEVSNGLADIQGDYNVQNENLKKQIQYIQEDLSTNRGNLSLEQQSELASLASTLIDRQKTFELNMNQLGAQKASQLDNLELDYRKSIDDINKNISFTQEEKAVALDKINRDFNENRGQLIGSAANAGLTFSTKRKIAEQKLNEENRGIVESTMRTYNKQLGDLVANSQYATAQYGQQKGNIGTEYQFSTQQQQQAYETAQRQIQEERDKVQRQYSQRIAELETEASRGNTQAQAEMTNLQRKLQSSLASASLSAEKYLGTENMPLGTPTIGGITGQLYDEKVKDIAQRQAGLYGELTQSSLNF